MTDADNSRPIGLAPVTDAASAGALPKPANDTTYPVDAPKVSSNADLRVAEDEEQIDAAMSPTGLDIADDHADEQPVNRSQDAPEKEADDQFTPTE